MSKSRKHFKVTKHLPNKARIEFSGIVYNNIPDCYDIEDVRFTTLDHSGKEVMETITQWFHSFRDITDPEFHNDNIVELLTEWLNSDEAKFPQNHLKESV
jgi:hypothetical protein